MVNTFSIHQRSIEGIKKIFFYRNVIMIVVTLILEFRNFRIDGNNRISKLVSACERVDETISSNDYIVHWATFVPPIGIATEKNC